MPSINWEQVSISVALIAAGTWIVSTIGVALFNKMFETFDRFRSDGIERERLAAEHQKYIVESLMKVSSTMTAVESALKSLMAAIEDAPCGERIKSLGK